MSVIEKLDSVLAQHEYSMQAPDGVTCIARGMRYDTSAGAFLRDHGPAIRHGPRGRQWG